MSHWTVKSYLTPLTIELLVMGEKNYIQNQIEETNR